MSSMENPIFLTKDPSGNNFIYDVSIYKIWKQGFCILGSKYYLSKKYIEPYTKIKKYRDYIIEKTVTLL